MISIARTFGAPVTEPLGNVARKIAPSPAEAQSFAEGFPFEETDDQAQAIEQVAKDLASARPMDRIVCCDVGFGKTEVAMRAAFAAVQDGKQVAVLVPTSDDCAGRSRPQCLQTIAAS